MQNSTKKSPPPKSIILLGDNESGRSTLVSRLKNVESVSKGIGLEYHYIDIKDEDRDDIPKLGVWIPDGDGSCTNLLKFALNETNYEHTLIVFVVSMSTPWSIMESLSKWATIIHDHIKKLNIPEEKRKEYLNGQIRAFQAYQDPDESLASKGANGASTAGTGGVVAGASGAITKMISVDKEDDFQYPLDPAILNKNIGLPVMVVVTKVSSRFFLFARKYEQQMNSLIIKQIFIRNLKSDCLSVLDKEMEYRIEHYDFIQYHIRRFCLDCNYRIVLFFMCHFLELDNFLNDFFTGFSLVNVKSYFLILDIKAGKVLCLSEIKNRLIFIRSLL